MLTTVPASQECLENLVKWICFAVSGRMDSRISPWLSGTPLSGLNEKDGGEFRPIAVGEVLHLLISRVALVQPLKSKLPDLLLPYDRAGVRQPFILEKDHLRSW